MTDPTFADFRAMTVPPITVERIESDPVRNLTTLRFHNVPSELIGSVRLVIDRPAIAVMHGRRPNSTRCTCGAAKVCAVDAATLNAGGRSARDECDHDEKWAVHKVHPRNKRAPWELTYHPPFGHAVSLAVVRTWPAAILLADFARKSGVRYATSWTRAVRNLIDAL